MPGNGDRDDDEILIEYWPIGNAVKVSAIDPRTGDEVSIVGPSTAGEALLGRQAVAKLRAVQRRRGRDARDPEPGGPDKGGIVV